jgi:hypothetical protein
MAVWWLSVVAIPLGSAAVAIAADSQWLRPDHLSALERARLGSRVFLTEAALVVVAAPLAGVFSVRRTRLLAAEPLPRPVAVAVLGSAWQLARPLMAGVTMLALTSALMALVLATPIDTITLLTSHAIFWAASLALAALGAACAAAFREPLDAAACALGIALVTGVGLFVAGPALDEVPRRLLNVALVANPIVASAAAANIDIFRTDPLYQLSPLAHTQIDYPTPGATFAWYVLITTLLFVGTARQLSRRVSDPSLERMSV